MSEPKIKITIPQEPFNQLDAWSKKLGYKGITDFQKQKENLLMLKRYSILAACWSSESILDEKT